MKNICIANVMKKDKSKNSSRLDFETECLHDMGFIFDALVQFLPEPNGAVFTLCNENIEKYSELYRKTKEKGGLLLKITNDKKHPVLKVSGTRLYNTGLVCGDKLIALCEYGFIRMRKIPNGGTVMLTTSHVVGKWLCEYGFVSGAVLTIASEYGLITCTLQENGAEKTAELVKYARQNHLKLLQVNKQKQNSGIMNWFDIPQSCLEKAGFAFDDLLFAVCEYGSIKLQKPDFKALGF